MDRFEGLLAAIQQTGAPKDWRDALARVADTAFICRAWLDEHTKEFTTADLLLMTRMVMDSESAARNHVD